MSGNPLPLVVAAVAKSEAGEVRVSILPGSDKPSLDIRLYAPFSAARLAMRTAKGVTIDLADLPDLVRVLQDAACRAQELGLMADKPAGGAE